MEWVFWVSAALPVYAYAGFPLLLIALERLFRRPRRKGPIEPALSLIIPAYAEGEQIAAKIENCLQLDYPAGKLEILVSCDGDKNGTPESARKAAAGTRVKVLVQPKNLGKVGNLNTAVAQSGHEVLVFSDASAMLKPDALRELVCNFNDPEVGAVGGKYMIVKPEAVKIGQSEDFYWRYETYLKTLEASIHSMLGAHGQLNAIRRELYPYPDPETINDDYVIPYAVLSKGYRAVYEPAALVWEEAGEMVGFSRRVRIMAGNIQQMNMLGGLLNPLRGWPLFFTLSHKVSRVFVPWAMVLALVSNGLLLDSGELYRWTMAAQAAFYGLALLGTAIRLRPKALMLPYYFTMINMAAFFGAYHALTSRKTMKWK